VPDALAMGARSPFFLKPFHSRNFSEIPAVLYFPAHSAPDRRHGLPLAPRFNLKMKKTRGKIITKEGDCSVRCQGEWLQLEE
jgi:hypothetical protein